MVHARVDIKILPPLDSYGLSGPLFASQDWITVFFLDLWVEGLSHPDLGTREHNKTIRPLNFSGFALVSTIA